MRRVRMSITLELTDRSDVEKWVEEIRKNYTEKSRIKQQIYIYPTVWSAIRPHRLKAIRFIFSRFFEFDVKGGWRGGIIGHCMGSGKTLTAIALMIAAASAFASPNSGCAGAAKLVVVCPKARRDLGRRDQVVDSCGLDW